MSAADLTEIIDGIGKRNSVFGLITLHKKRHPLIPVQIVECCRMRQAMRLGEFPHTGHKILHPVPKFLVTHTSQHARLGYAFFVPRGRSIIAKKEPRQNCRGLF